MSLAGCCTALSRFFHSDDFSPALSSASATAVRYAMLDKDAPVTTSTFSVWLSTISLPSFSMHTSPKPADSRESSTSMRSMAPSFVTTSIWMAPCLPMPLPTVATLASSESSFEALPDGAHPPSVSAPPAVASAAPVRNCLRESPVIVLILLVSSPASHDVPTFTAVLFGTTKT